MRAAPFIDRPSPNRDGRRSGAVDILLLHYTGMTDAAAALDRLCDPEARVSAHYLIAEDGAIWRLVPEAQRAWHAGVSSWGGATDINDRSVGVELVNPGHALGYRPFPHAQMTALEQLARALLRRHRIPARRVLGHSDVAPARKKDPGELFDWRRLARAGIGVWPPPPRRDAAPAPAAPGDCGARVAALQSGLAAYGYGVAASGEYDAGTTAVVTAFQRHFRPRRVDGVCDSECACLLAALLALPA